MGAMYAAFSWNAQAPRSGRGFPRRSPHRREMSGPLHRPTRGHRPTARLRRIRCSGQPRIGCRVDDHGFVSAVTPSIRLRRNLGSFLGSAGGILARLRGHFLTDCYSMVHAA